MTLAPIRSDKVLAFAETALEAAQDVVRGCALDDAGSDTAMAQVGHGTDYEHLLRKYMDHVRQCEGIDFVDRIGESCCSNVRFSDEEKIVLTRLSRALDDTGK
jgi:hypothetical protein